MGSIILTSIGSSTSGKFTRLPMYVCINGPWISKILQMFHVEICIWKSIVKHRHIGILPLSFYLQTSFLVVYRHGIQFKALKVAFTGQALKHNCTNIQECTLTDSPVTVQTKWLVDTMSVDEMPVKKMTLFPCNFILKNA